MALGDKAWFYDWNRSWSPGRGLELLDETLRDGIQSPSVTNPSIPARLEILHCMEACGIHCVDVGLPGAGPQALLETRRMVEEIRDQRLRLKPNCAARTHLHDLQAVADILQATGHPLEVCAFLGCSRLRRQLEGWELKDLRRRVADSVRFAVEHGLQVTFVTEDTTRTDPYTLRQLYRVALDGGATRLVLTDTVGSATPAGVRRLVRFVRRVLARWGYLDVGLDWHGHNDRGLALGLCLTALEEGVDRVHGTCMGLGERVGNAPLDLLMVNLRLLNFLPPGLTAVRAYVECTSAHLGVAIPAAYPVFGSDAFRTATGVHAAAILKAQRLGDGSLADQIYSSVSAAELGLEQKIELGYYSGRANVVAWLEAHELEPTPQRVELLLAQAKQSRSTLPAEEIFALLGQEFKDAAATSRGSSSALK